MWHLLNNSLLSPHVSCVQELDFVQRTVLILCYLYFLNDFTEGTNKHKKLTMRMEYNK